jgi:hypothetical protein
MTFMISVPHRSADESLVAVAGHTRVLGQDGPVMRELVISARLDGVAATAGQLIAHLDQLEPHERRAMLNTARKACGLPSVEEVEASRPKPFDLTVRTTGPSGAFPSCPAEGCTASPTRYGAFYTPDARKWWCPNHEHLAEPGDLEPRGSGLVYSPAGVPIDFNPAADEADREREASRRAQLQAEGEIRAVEAAELRASNRARDEAHRSELPEHLRRLGA